MGFHLPFSGKVQASLVAFGHSSLKLCLQFQLLLWREGHFQLCRIGRFSTPWIEHD